MKELLLKLNACEEAREWAEGKTWEEIYSTCHRGDWLLWLFKRTNPDDLKLLTLAKGHCVDTISHLMKDERSKNAVKVAIAFGEGTATREELDAAAADAAAAAVAAADAAADAYAYAAAACAADAADAAYAAVAAAAYTAATAADAAYAAYTAAAYTAATAADAAAYTADDTRTNHLKLTADICRKYLPIEVWNIERETK